MRFHNSPAQPLTGGETRRATPTVSGWIADLEELLVKFGDAHPLCYGGRGEIAPLKQATADQITYLKQADSIVTRYDRSLGDRKNELQNEKAGLHYSALQGEFEKAFPGYSLSYMIQYGIYGLVNSKL